MFDSFPATMRIFQPSRATLVDIFTVILPLIRLNERLAESATTFNSSEVDFATFMRKFNRTYEVDSEEFKLRHFYFQKATERYISLNSFSPELQSAKYGINQFSDLSQKEFRDLYLRATSDRFPRFSGQTTVGLPARFDWRDKAAVAPVQNQLACGSCWAFAVVGAIQSVRAIQTARLQLLSVQQLVDCSYQNKGCGGGSPCTALQWLKQTTVKLVTQSEYPYQAKTQFCRFFPQSHGEVAVKDFSAHDFGEQEEAMKGQLVRHGPLVAVVDAVSWQDYQGGIIQHHCSSHWANHAALIVGYDATGTIPYWIVQNSWGRTWGNEGYVYIKLGGNVCGIADSVAAVSL